MGEAFTEQLVRQKMTGKTMLKLVGLVALVLVSIVATMILPILSVLVVVALFVAYYFGKRLMCVEFEYVYFNGELDIDRIMGMEARKRLLSTSVKDMEVLAPSGASVLQPYQNLKVYDCSTNSGNHTYELVAKVKEQNVRIIFEPNEEILQGMRYYAPRKVYL
ncbi:MAG: hypothetical protein UHS49_01285 [Faecalimonas sp.]|nr:hypothetical protein [Faecalimonas sp.]